MTFSLYAAVIPPYQRMLGNLDALLDKAEAWAADQGIAEKDILGARLAPDMLDFAYQVKSASVHSIGAIEGVKRGSFSPDRTPPGESFAALREQLRSTRAAIDAISPAEIDILLGRNVRFAFGSHHADFTAEEFLTSMSRPNFYFHMTIAYALLRAQGMPIGKTDYIGKFDFVKDEEPRG
ncbi:DUF1993 domain-containing protein [Rhizorhabdus argentea]|uniref:DUF1993 domain-containing protein n=1 Tax=Rhizorhabdus argentea TaxID=1387174 RepID=UPI0030ECA177